MSNRFDETLEKIGAKPMITVEEIREIAEGLFPDAMVEIPVREDATHVYVVSSSGKYSRFSPTTDWRDTGLVLEDLKANPRATSIEIIEDAVHVTIDDQGYVSGEGSTLQESICRAWLAVNKQGE